MQVQAINSTQTTLEESSILRKDNVSLCQHPSLRHITSTDMNHILAHSCFMYKTYLTLKDVEEPAIPIVIPVINK